jgi:hypothetical protein
MSPKSLVLPVLLAFAAPAFAGPVLNATLSGANEVDAQGAGGKGDADGSGSFSGKLADGKLCYTLSADKIDAPTMAHIHTGAAGANGGVFVPLTELGAGEHCAPIDAAKAEALLANPAGYYVNIHNAAYPAGAVRGQLAKQ